MKKLLNYIIILSFLGFIGVISVINAMSPDKETAFYENRELAKKPTFTFETLSDGSYFRNFESYFLDQFYEKENILQSYTKLSSKIKSISNSWLPEGDKGIVVDGYFVNKDGWILQVPNPNENDVAVMKKYADNINELAKTLKETGSEVFYFNTPYKSSIMDHLYPSYLSKEQDLKERETFLSMLDNSVLKIIDIHSYFDKTFSVNDLEKMYFKTDHHWNIDGANAAFDYMIKAFNEKNDKDLQLKPINKQEVKCISDENFLGSWNRVIYGLVDTVENVCYEPVPKDLKHVMKVEKKNGDKYQKLKINDIYGVIEKVNPEYVTYGYLTTGDYPEFTIYNPNSVTDKTLVVIKDSYFNALVMKVSEQFRKVTVLDPRHVIERSIYDFFENNNYDYVWFFYANNAYFTPQMFNFKAKTKTN